MVTGCLLCGWAPAASAQTLLAKTPPVTAHAARARPHAPPGTAPPHHATPYHATPHHASPPDAPYDAPYDASPHHASPHHASPHGHAGAATTAPGGRAHANPSGGPHRPAGIPHFEATAPSAYATPLTTAGSSSAISFNFFSALSSFSPQVTSSTSGTTTVSHRATFVKGPAPLTPPTSTTQPSATTGTTGNGNGNGNGSGSGSGSGSGKANAKANGKGATTGKGNPNARGQGGRPPATGHSRTGRTGLVRPPATPVPVQGPARPERFFTIPLAAAPAASGPLPAGGLSLAPAARAGSQLFHFGAAMLPRGWAGESIHEADQLKLPIALLVAMAVFILGQSLVDRRDPKVSEAPERPNDDSLEFR